MVFRKGPLIGTGRGAEVFAWGEGNTEVLKLFYRSDATDAARIEAETTTLVHQEGGAVIVGLCRSLTMNNI